VSATLQHLFEVDGQHVRRRAAMNAAYSTKRAPGE